MKFTVLDKFYIKEAEIFHICCVKELTTIGNSSQFHYYFSELKRHNTQQENTYKLRKNNN